MQSATSRVLLVTNDFPPTVGGIQSYLEQFVSEVVARRGRDSIVVFASTQDVEAAKLFDAAQEYLVHRWPRTVMLPTPAVAREMKRVIREHKIDTVWFGAAAPLALLAQEARKAGAMRIVSTTHGHEVGWSMLPVARQMLRRIGKTTDTLTYVSEYTRRRFSSAFGAHPDYVALPSGVDTEFFRPATSAQKVGTRSEFGYGDEPLVVVASRLVARKGQDQLIRGWGTVQEAFPDARLAVIGEGPYRKKLEQLAVSYARAVTFHGRLPRTSMRDLVAAADIMAMPARTRGGGLDVEGLGIVYLEAQACGVPVIAGTSGGAPETVTPDTGIVVDGSRAQTVAEAVVELLGDGARRKAMGLNGRQHVSEIFSWQALGDRLEGVLFGEQG